MIEQEIAQIRKILCPNCKHYDAELKTCWFGKSLTQYCPATKVQALITQREAAMVEALQSARTQILFHADSREYHKLTNFESDVIVQAKIDAALREVGK
jgi:hypothetical protein